MKNWQEDAEHSEVYVGRGWDKKIELEGGYTDGRKIQNYSDPLDFSGNVRGFSRNPHARRKKIGNAGSRSLPKNPHPVACGEGDI